MATSTSGASPTSPSTAGFRALIAISIQANVQKLVIGFTAIPAMPLRFGLAPLLMDSKS